MNANQFNYLDIDDYPTMQNNLNTDRYKIWDQLFPLDEKKSLHTQEDEIY